MSVQKSPARTALIGRICEAHRDADPDGPDLTIVEDAWAYCAGHGDSDHVWRVIDPAPRDVIEDEIARR